MTPPARVDLPAMREPRRGSRKPGAAYHGLVGDEERRLVRVVGKAGSSAAFRRELSGLAAKLAEACQVAGRAMQCCDIGVVARRHRRLADDAISDSRFVRSLTKKAEDNARELLALQAPVASDLRTIVAAIHIAGDVDRMSGLARHVARDAIRTTRCPTRSTVSSASRAVALGKAPRSCCCIQTPRGRPNCSPPTRR